MKFPSKSSRPLLRTFVACLAASLLLLLLPAGWTGRARLAAAFPVCAVQGAFLADVFGPVERCAGRIARLWRSADEARELRRQNAQLLAQLVQESERRRALEQQLSQRGQLPAELRPHAVVVRLLSFDASALRRTAVFNKGANAGIAVNAPVLSNGALIGRVDSVCDWSCRVALIGDRACGMGVRCARSRVQGVLKSAGGGLAEVDDIERSADVKPGDLFITSGVDGVFPAGLLVGACLETSTEAGAMFQWIIIKPAFDVALLEDASILLPESVEAD